MRFAGSWLLVLVGCGQEIVLDQFQKPPTVLIREPVENPLTVPELAAVTFVGNVIDDAEPAELEVEWRSTLDGLLQSGPAPDSSGVVTFTTVNLTPGNHGVTLWVKDPDGNVGQVTTTVIVEDRPEPPEIVDVDFSPTSGAEEGEEVVVRAQITDAQDAGADLLVTIRSDLDGVICEGTGLVGVGDVVECPFIASGGQHEITVAAVDTDGNAGSETFELVVADLPEEPRITVIRPIPGEPASVEGEVYEVEVEVWDRVDDASVLAVAIRSDLQGDLCVNPPVGAGGRVICGFRPIAGVHTLTLSVEDTAANRAQAVTFLNVTARTTIDDDGDGFSEAQGDCDDGNDLSYPGGREFADGRDNDCDNRVDEGTDAADDDGDGYCEGPTCADGTVPGDCDDSLSQINPGAQEICGNQRDDNCSGFDEPTGLGCTIYTYDGDGDGAGVNQTSCRCAPGDGYTATSTTDCDDFNNNIAPGKPEIADRRDNDCDNSLDEGTEYYDNDGDGYCPSDLPCTLQPWQQVPWSGGDCNDLSALERPGGAEVCNDGRDNNCNGVQNEDGATNCTIYYVDADFDTYGGSQSACVCNQSPGFVLNAQDCYDGNPDARPNQTGYFAVHRGDGSFDYNCDGQSRMAVTETGECDYPCEIFDGFDDGWWGGVPGCGAQGQWLTDCSIDWFQCDEDTEYRTQTCQ